MKTNYVAYSLLTDSTQATEQQRQIIMQLGCTASEYPLIGWRTMKKFSDIVQQAHFQPWPYLHLLTNHKLYTPMTYFCTKCRLRLYNSGREVLFPSQNFAKLQGIERTQETRGWGVLY